MAHERMSERINSHTSEEFLEAQKVADIKTDFATRLVTIMLAALGLITALAWDRTLEDIFTNFFGPLNRLSIKILYAVLITLLTVTLTIFLRRIFIIKKERYQRRRHPRS